MDNSSNDTNDGLKIITFTIIAVIVLIGILMGIFILFVSKEDVSVVEIPFPGCFWANTDAEVGHFLNNIAKSKDWRLKARDSTKKMGPDNFEVYTVKHWPQSGENNLFIGFFDKNFQKNHSDLHYVPCNEKTIHLRTVKTFIYRKIASCLYIKNDEMELNINAYSDDPKREMTKKELNQLHDLLPPMYKL